MTYYTNVCYKNGLICEKNAFLNMLNIIHLWNYKNYININHSIKKFLESNWALNLNFINLDLTHADLVGVDLTGANLIDANLTGADLSGAILTKTIFNENSISSITDKCDLSNALIYSDRLKNLITYNEFIESIPK